MKWDNNIVVAVDFDGTIVSENYRVKRKAIKYLKKIKNLGCVIVLWTCREKERLEEATEICNSLEVPIDYVNSYPLREKSRKLNADFYIDNQSMVGKIRWRRIYVYLKKKVK